jgi:hypothetical protein
VSVVRILPGNVLCAKLRFFLLATNAKQHQKAKKQTKNSFHENAPLHKKLWVLWERKRKAKPIPKTGINAPFRKTSFCVYGEGVMPDPCFALNIFYGYFVFQRQKTGDRKEPARVNISVALFIGITLSF